MQRREFVAGSVAAWVGSAWREGRWLAKDLRAEQSRPDGDSRMEIENPYYLVAVDAKNGAIVKLLDKRGGINLISETRHSVFQNPKTGKRACVVVNMGEKSNRASIKAFEGNTNGKVIVRQPFNPPRAGNLPLELEIPSERFVIVAEA